MEWQSESWLKESLAYFRGLEFYPGDFEEWLKRIQAYPQEEYGESWEHWIGQCKTQQAADSAVLALDAGRVWWRDLECVYPGEQAYVQVLLEWSAISRGAFDPQKVSEIWESPDGPVQLSFQAKGRLYQHLHQGGDYLDMKLLTLVNQAIAFTPYCFEVLFDSIGDGNYVVVLTKSEKTELQTKRGWRFL